MTDRNGSFPGIRNPFPKPSRLLGLQAPEAWSGTRIPEFLTDELGQTNDTDLDLSVPIRLSKSLGLNRLRECSSGQELAVPTSCCCRIRAEEA
jgi:hypothetical protein